jgi:hypothetical protein
MEKDPHNLYLCPNIIRHIKSRGMKWTGHVAHMGEGIKLYNTLVRKPEERDHSENRGVVGRMELEWILRRLAVWILVWIQLAQDWDR